MRFSAILALVILVLFIASCTPPPRDDGGPVVIVPEDNDTVVNDTDDIPPRNDTLPPSNDTGDDGASTGGGRGGGSSGGGSDDDDDDIPPETSDNDRDEQIIIGVEYAFPGTANAFSELEITGVKFYPEQYTIWEKMQPSQNAEIDFSNLDRMVREFQDAGMYNIVMGMRHDNSWASIDKGLIKTTNPLPKEEFVDEYEHWFRSVVERYDHDGVDDMPGLERPVQYYEIGVELSSFEPEPVEQYVEHLARAYRVAHEAYPDVVIAHAAFLPMGAFDDDPSPSQYEQAFANRQLPDKNHGLEDMRFILDHPESFDVVNVHSLAEVTEPEKIMEWLQYEMDQRDYEKPVIISDTAITPFAAFGRGDKCDGLLAAKIFAPVTPERHCDVAAYFEKIIDGDPETVSWMYAFIAGDVVKRTVIAADAGFVLINTAFTEDLSAFQKLIPAGTGNSGWAGMLDVKINAKTQERTVLEKRPSFYALQQLQDNWDGYESIERVSVDDPEVRLYEVEMDDETFWIAWLQPDTLVLPSDVQPSKTVSIPGVSGSVRIEQLIKGQGRTIPDVTTGSASSVMVTMTPVFVFEE